MAKSKFPWLKLRKKTDPELPEEPPVWFGTRSNGEYFQPPTKDDLKIRKEILKRADDLRRYVGMERREFLASTMGMALTMTVLNEVTACSSDGAAAATGGSGDGGGGGDRYGIKGPYVVPPEATCDPSAYIDVSGGEGHEFIMDVQTHSFDKGEWREKQVAYPIFLGVLPGDPSCTEANHLDCFGQDHYAELMFVDSDTTMSVITSWPAAQCFPERKLLGQDAFACGLPLSNEGMRDLRNWVNDRAMSQRVINQVQVMPNDLLEHQIEGMHAAMSDSEWRCGSWKAYPAWRSDNYPDSNGGASGYFMTDPVGRAFIEEGLKLGVPNFAIHKGLPIPGFDVEHNKPTDIGTIAIDYQAANFVIYHSAINAGTGGGVLAAVTPQATENVPYAPTGEVFGVNMLIRDLIEKGVIDDPDAPGTKKAGVRLNVFAEMGSAWSQVMTKKDRSAEHYMGKLLKYLGPDNIVWGTDCILSGSPQVQIEMFRKFQIGEDFQQQYGYPAITTEMKAKIFGLNAARIYRIDPNAARCKADANSFTAMKQRMDNELGPRRWAVKPPTGPRTWREFWAHAREARAKGVPG